MCEYCKCYWEHDKKYLLSGRTDLSKKGDFYPGIDIHIDPEENVLVVESVADVYEPTYMEEKIRINFCPMCGCKL